MSVSNWREHEYYWEHLAPQQSDEWGDAKKFRSTASNGGAMGGRSKFSTPEEKEQIIAGVKEKDFKPKNLLIMEHGNKTEPLARNYYSEKYNCKVIERGLCIPKNSDEMWLGASVDGDVIGTDGIIEIKCPLKMYYPLKIYMEHKSNGIFYDNYNHIYPTHFAQMQQGMAILRKKWLIMLYIASLRTLFLFKEFLLIPTIGIKNYTLFLRKIIKNIFYRI